MRPGQLAAGLAAFTSLSSAWPGQDILENSADRAVQGLEQVQRLWRRQDAITGSATRTTATSRTTTAQTQASVTASNTARSTGTSQRTASGTARETGSAAASETDSDSAATSYDARLPAGGISMMTPNPLSSSQYYKVGDWVTFAWNFTSVSAKPSAVNVLASNTLDNVIYTLGANMSYKDEMKVLWDTSQYAKDGRQLITNQYTLVVENADESVATAIAKAGYFQSAANFYFGMYTPQPYTPWNQFSCPTCNSAMSSQERQTLGFLFAMFSITVLSFTYFATGRFCVL